MNSSFTLQPPLLPSGFPQRPRAPFKALIPLLGSACTCPVPGVPFSIPKDPNLAHSSKLKFNTIFPEKPCFGTQETTACPLSYLVFGLLETLHAEFTIMALSSVTPSEFSKGEVPICILFLGTAQELEKYLLNE